VTHVKDETVSPAATRALVATLQQNTDLDEGSVNGLKTCLNEVIENVFYHAESPTDALVSAQAYKQKAANGARDRRHREGHQVWSVEDPQVREAGNG
jgi:hypothetical protein